jgi:predicted dehydrogenase
MAAKAGKDVICEKPLTLTVAEGRLLCDVVGQTGRISQTASENRSIDCYIRLVELVRGGAIGKLRHVEVRLPVGNNNIRVRGAAKGLFNDTQTTDPPKTLNYEMWLGQAPLMPYIAGRTHGNFRWNLTFSGGVICDWGAHLIDLAQWAHATEHSGPATVEGKGDFPPRQAVYNTAPTFEVHYQYADGVTMTVSAGEGDLDPNKSYPATPMVGRTEYPGIRFEGADGWVESHKWRGSLKASRRSILDTVIDPAQVRLYRPSEIVARKDGSLGGEHRNFLDSVKSRQPCYAPFETGHRTVTIAHIGNIAMLLGRKLRWNSQTERFVDDAEADKMLSRHQREPWTVANIDSWIRRNS